MKEPNRKLYIAKPYLDKVQLLCLLIMAVFEFLILSLGYLFLDYYPQLLSLGMAGACGLFLIALMLRMYQTRKILFPILPCIMVIWFLILRIIHNAMQMDTYSITLFIPVYLLAFPFAAFSQNDKKQTSLKLVSLILVAAGLILTLDSVLLLAKRVPVFLQNHIYWDGTRLNVMLHPNVSARVFMVGIAFCIGLMTQFRKTWLKVLLAIAAFAMFIAMALTNCRSAIVVTCLMVAGAVFFSIYKNNWKQFLIGAAAAVVVMAILVWGANAIFKWNSQQLSEGAQLQQEQIFATEAKLSQPSYMPSQLSKTGTASRSSLLALRQPNKAPSPITLSAASGEEHAATENITTASPQGTFFGDLLSLNSRTTIWRNVLQGLRENPSALLWGARSVPELTGIPGVTHTHNSLLDALLRLGLPGFIISLLFTAQALWSAAYLLLKRNADLWKKIIAMLVLCLLISAMMEPFLFITTEHYHFANFIFFLCLGYLVQWRKALRKSA